MTFLVTIITNGLSGIPLRPFASTSTWVIPRGISCINPDGRDGILRPPFSIAPLPFLLLLLLFSSLLRGLSTIRALKSWDLLFLEFECRFLDPWVFYWLALSTGCGCWRLTTPKAVLIGVVSIRARFEAALILASTVFLTMSSKLLSSWPRSSILSCTEVSNYCTFLWGKVKVKFNQGEL